MKNDFGLFVNNKRVEKKITLRGFANTIGISLVYASNIENGIRPAPSYEVLLKISKILVLNEDEQDLMFDLAAKSKNTPSIANDLVIYVNDNNIVYAALRKAKRLNISDEDWNDFIDNISEKYT